MHLGPSQRSPLTEALSHCQASAHTASSPQDVVAIEPYGSIPILASGIRIDHNRKDYLKRMLFWCMGRRSTVLEEIANTGFRPTGVNRSSVFLDFRFAGEHRDNRGRSLERTVPSRPGSFRAQPQRPGLLSLLALVLAFCAATATQTSADFQRLVMREGHEVAVD